MKRLILVTLALSLTCSNAFALAIPKGSKYDGRIQSTNFNDRDVVKVLAADGFSSSIVFAEDERVLVMSSGFSDGWDIVDKGNILFIKPISAGTNQEPIVPIVDVWDTNLLVTTTKRVYAFDLILVDPKAKHTVSYRIDINYPQDRQKAIETEKAQKEAKKKDQELKDELSTVKTPRNWAYYMKVAKGSESIAPNYAYDDGLFTYLGFDKDKSFPSVFLFDNNQESILNTNVKYDGQYQVLVIQKTAPKLILRSGDKVIGIFNDGYRLNSSEYNTTVSDKVVRVTK
jgi:type IV secretion system protein VirB9